MLMCFIFFIVGTMIRCLIIFLMFIHCTLSIDDYPLSVRTWQFNVNKDKFTPFYNDNNPMKLIEPIRRANFWKRANFWRRDIRKII